MMFFLLKNLKHQVEVLEKWVNQLVSNYLFLSINLTLGKEKSVQSQVSLCSWLGDILKSLIDDTLCYVNLLLSEKRNTTFPLKEKRYFLLLLLGESLNYKDHNWITTDAKIHDLSVACAWSILNTKVPTLSANTFQGPPVDA